MSNTEKKRKQLIINAFDMSCSGLQSPGLWKHPKDRSPDFGTIGYWTNLAKTLEKAKFNAIFIADVLAGYDVYNGPGNITAAAKSGAQFPIHDPFAVVASIASVTKNLSIAVTASTISEAPYLFARRLATLDHLSNGRIGWNVVSSYLDSAARNVLNGENLPPHDERYVRAQEYLDVIYELFLLSWRDDAVVLDKDRGVYSDPERIRQIDFEGKYFKVPGPSIVQPTPQRLPVILQAGASPSGVKFGAKNAEGIFVADTSPENLAPKVENLRKTAEEFGRTKDDIKIIQLVTVIVARTHDEAIKKFEEYKSYGDLEGAQALFSGWTGIDIGKFDWDEELSSSENNAIRGFLEKWTKKLPSDPEHIRKTRRYVADKITIGGSGVVIVGSPSEVVDELERWVDIADIDGFNFTYTITPGSFEDLAEFVIPELRRRGLVWNDYPKDGLTFRENLFGLRGEDAKFLRKSHPAYGLRWRAGESKESFEKRIQEIKANKKN